MSRHPTSMRKKKRLNFTDDLNGLAAVLALVDACNVNSCHEAGLALPAAGAFDVGHDGDVRGEGEAAGRVHGLTGDGVVLHADVMVPSVVTYIFLECVLNDF